MRCCVASRFVFLPRLQTSRQVLASSSQAPIATLYAAPISLYSGKARAYLRYKSYPFEEVLPSMKILEEVIKPRTGLKMIPVLITPDDVAVQDTSEIIDHVESLLPNRRPVFQVRRFKSSSRG